MKISFFSIQKLCVHDGPGIRTVVFLAGCYLHCPWCCNPEGIFPQSNFFFNDEKCLYKKGIPSLLCRDCEVCGGLKDKFTCPLGTCRPTVVTLTTEKVVSILLQDKSLYEDSNGGVTFSGGEPFWQAPSIKSLFLALKKEHIHIAVETSAYFPHSSLSFLEEWIDLYIVDLKLQSGFIKNEVVGKDYTNDFYSNLITIQENTTNVIYRLVYIPEYMDKNVDRKRIINELKKLRISSIQLLSYHNLAFSKYKQMGISFNSFSIPQEKNLESFKYLLSQEGIECEILTNNIIEYET